MEANIILINSTFARIIEDSYIDGETTEHGIQDLYLEKTYPTIDSLLNDLPFTVKKENCIVMDNRIITTVQTYANEEGRLIQMEKGDEMYEKWKKGEITGYVYEMDINVYLIKGTLHEDTETLSKHFNINRYD